MKQQALNEIEQLIKTCNESNIQLGKEYQYEITVCNFAEGCYSADICYNNIFFGTDMDQLIKIITANSIHFFAGVSHGIPFLHIQ